MYTFINAHHIHLLHFFSHSIYSLMYPIFNSNSIPRLNEIFYYYFTATAVLPLFKLGANVHRVRKFLL